MFHPPVRLTGSALCLLVGLASACQVAPARAWNLEQLHTPEGFPKYRAHLKSNLQYVLSDQLGSLRILGGAPERADASGEGEELDDPLGACFENVRALAACTRTESVAGWQAESFGWLAIDCSYPLSREQCVLALGELGPALELEHHLRPLPSSAASPEDVRTRFDELRGAFEASLAAPELAGVALREACERAGALELDRAGALRLLRAANALLAREERGALLEPLRALRLDLARRVVEFALRAALEDGNGRVRAAALEACLRAFPAERDARLRWALSDPMEGVQDGEEVSLRALEFLARYGLPARPESTPESEFRRSWEELLGTALRAQIDGPHTIATCRALAKVRGEPTSLRAEVWLARTRTPLSLAPPAEPRGMNR